MLPSVEKLLHDIKLQDIVRNQVVFVRSTDTVEQALEVLSKHNVQSVPVLTPEDHCIGSIDHMDMIVFLSRAHQICQEVEQKGVVDFFQVSEEEFVDSFSRSAKFALTEVRELVDFSQRNPYASIQLTNDVDTSPTLLDVAKLFVKESNLRRVAVLDTTGQHVGIVSQSTVISILAQHSSCLGDYGEKTIHDFGWDKRGSTVTIHRTLVALQAFHRLHTRDVYGAAIVDDEDHIQGYISGSDLKGMLTNMGWRRLMQPVSEYVRFVREQQRRMPHFAVYTSPQAKLRAVIEIAAKNSVHRVVVADVDFKPVGVVALDDILRAVLQLDDN
eukprot:TRINITY_DN743_c0_g2_i2.p1 TRINITY_DN743_c0_g2~~TRINITY_DN743_c0_g2_i2.p1  ORF type:complete len:329 (-),score=92.06 TRINITY_DN743_c0_g2_i2:107-1093(-)